MSPTARRPGRPKLDAHDPADSVVVMLRLPAKQFDDVQQRAKRERLTLSAYVRRAVTADDRVKPER